MKVKAIATGFYGGHRRRPGAEFEVPEGTKGKWFVPVEPPAPADAPEEKQRRSRKEKPASADVSEAQGAEPV